MFRFFVFLILLHLTVSCQKFKGLSSAIDLFSFSLIGGTFFSSPSFVTMKEIHLDKGEMNGQQVVLEGKVIEIGRYQTYAIVSDETGRMLVLLTEIDSAKFKEKLDEEYKNYSLRILGQIENGKKGLPYVQAKAIQLISKQKSM